MLLQCSLCKEIKLPLLINSRLLSHNFKDIDVPRYNKYFYKIVKQIKNHCRIFELSELSWSKIYSFVSNIFILQKNMKQY